jgi:hypothetical protein
MPYQFQIDPEHALIRETFVGQVTADELVRLCAEEWAHPDYRKGLNVLTDLRAAHVEVSFEQMVQYVAFAEQGQGAGRQAIVVASQLEFGLARMFESISEARGRLWVNLRIFHDITEAERWVMSGEEPEAETTSMNL